MKKISFEIKIENQLSEIVKVINHFKTFSKDHAIKEKLVNMICIAFDELLNNTISYGYNDMDVHEITVNVLLRESDLMIRITDDGYEYNPFQEQKPDTSSSISEREIGGLGIHIVKSIMDNYNYERTSNKNVITLIKNKINN